MPLNPKADRKAYHKAMMEGLDGSALQIEERYGLVGYPPEIVSHVLQIAANIAISEQDRCARAAFNWAHRSWGTPEFNLTDCREALNP